MRALLIAIFVMSMFSIGCGGSDTVFTQPQVSNASARILYPPATSTTDGGTVIVRGTASDEDGVAGVTVNGVPATSTDGFQTWEVTLPLGMGQQPI